MTDPLPQALILTAIVIGLGIAAYILALKYKYFEITGTHDLDQLSKTDQK
jgi:multicomponent Na+:H+ antiporter subunit C